MSDYGETTMQVYDAIKAYFAENRIPPSLRDLADATGLKSTSNVRYHLQKLEEWDMIERVPNVARGVFLKEEGVDDSA